MAAMRMMQVAGDAIIHVVSVRHRLVATAGAVRMSCLMPTAAMINGAAVGVLARHLCASVRSEACFRSDGAPTPPRATNVSFWPSDR
jgi:hypothetical protein